MIHKLNTPLGLCLAGFVLIPFAASFARATPLEDATISYPPRASYPLAGESFITAGIAVGDIDGDGDMDIVEANGRHWAQTNYIYFNANSRGMTSRRALGKIDRTSYTVKLADLDGDGDLDIIQASDKLKNQIFYNDGKGNFGAPKLFGSIASNTRSIQIADLNGDGHLDILEICRGTPNLIFLNDSTGHFPTMNGNHGDDEPIPFGDISDSTLSVEVRDMNGDNHVDLVLANRDKQQNKILLNNGKMDFTKSIPFGSGHDDTRGVAVADMNGDGHMDIVSANIREANGVTLSNGDGTYALTQRFGDEKGQSYALIAHDLDGDGDQDIVMGNRGTNKIYLNDGKGTLTLLTEFDGEKNTYALGLGDINGDGRPDIITGNSEGQNTIYYQRSATGKKSTRGRGE